MPAFNRVVLSGTLASGAEIWSVGINFHAPASTPISTPGDLTTWASNIDTVMDTSLAGALGTGLSTTGRLTAVTTYFYAATDAPASAVGSFATSTSGIGTARNPLQTSVVCSLRTPFAGRSYRGRFYWPLLGQTIETTGRLSGASTSALATAAANMLTGMINAAPASSVLEVGVVSRALDAVTTVTAVDVGDVPDTQRRRSQGLVDTRVTVAI